ncbi:hypothetical protein DL770_008797 [Monosporascus sp. CRB-9-2]|nr:hypothetical protein DL770_008797 [Monosporascus sp. CRB-9-2]
MVTGVESAGLVLGAIPLVLAGLEFYAKGIAVTKRCFKYREQFQSLIRELRTENIICTNSINLLLVGVVNQKDMADFLAEPCGDRWKEAKFDQRLKQRLGASYDSYMATIDELGKAAEIFRQRLKLDSSGKPQFTDEQMFKKYYKRLEFSIRKFDYDDLMATLRRANSSLHRLTTQSLSLENSQNSCKLNEQPIKNFKAIHDRAQGFHSALCSSWKCPCHADHSVSLRLESRIDDVQSDEDASEDEESMRDSFHVVFRYSHDGLVKPCGPTAAVKPWAWEEADVRITVESQSHIGTVSAARDFSRGKRVHFASQAEDAVKAALNPTPNLQPIQDLCAAISTLRTPQRDVCLSLLANEYAKQKYGILIYPSKEPPTDTDTWSISTLRSILEDSEFARRDRLRLAVTLSSSVLQLHETPWLDENWGKDDILFIKRSEKTTYHHPFVSHELWYGKPMSQLHKPEDGPLGDSMTEFNTADRLVDELYSEAGGKYSDAVRRCIRCDFDCRANSLEDIAFQRAVYEGVVAQLKENFDFLY